METILIVDDNINNLRLLDKLLRSSGYKVSVAKSGEEAIKITNKIIPDLIIMDIMMQGINGYEACKVIKSNSETSAIPVIFLSSLNETVNKVEGFNAGGVDYLTKPIDPEELFVRLNTHITIHRLKKQLEVDIIEKDKLLKQNIEKTEELIKTQKELFIAEKINSFGYLVSGLAHELNTPLGIGITSSSVINEEINFLKKQCAGGNKNIEKSLGSIKECNELINNNLQKLDTLIKGFKELSTSKIYTNSQSFSLLKLINKTISLALNAFSRTDIDISIVGEELIIENSYPEAFERVISSLVENSIIHGFKEQKDCRINIDIKKNTNNINIDYMDNGTGIPEDIISNIFDPFFTTTRSKGTGLGLSVAYNIITQKLDGELNYISETEGAHFNILFPIP